MGLIHSFGFAQAYPSGALKTSPKTGGPILGGWRLKRSLFLRSKIPFPVSAFRFPDFRFSNPCQYPELTPPGFFRMINAWQTRSGTCSASPPGANPMAAVSE
jgi:hypothetical protein